MKNSAPELTEVMDRAENVLEPELAGNRMESAIQGQAEAESLEDFADILNRFEQSAVSARWHYEGKGVSTLDKGAEDTKAASRQLRQSLVQMEKIKPDEDRVGAIIRAEGPCLITTKGKTHVITVAIHGDGQKPSVAGVTVPDRSIARVYNGEIKVSDRTAVYMVLLGN